MQSGKAVTVADDGTGLVIRTAEAGTAARQEWRLKSVQGAPGNRARYVFTDPDGGKRLAVRDDVPVLESDEGRPGAAAQWTLSTTGDGTWTLVNAATGRLLEVGGQATHEGAAVTTWPSNSGSNQRWRITDVTDGALAAGD